MLNEDYLENIEKYKEHKNNHWLRFWGTYILNGLWTLWCTLLMLSEILQVDHVSYLYNISSLLEQG